MGRSCSFFFFLLLLLLFLLLSPGPGAAFSRLRYRYDCGDYGMQLRAYPPRGRTVRFKVMDEFGTRFDVANCSICLHWLNAGADGAVVFSSGYEGCHVLVKEDRYVLRVQLEETLLSGGVAASYEVNMTCRQPGDAEGLGDGDAHAGRGNSVQQAQADGLVPLSQPGLLQHVSQSSFTLSGSQLSAQARSEQIHPVAQTQPTLNQPGLVHPGGQNRPGLLHPGVQTPNQPGLVHPGGQNRPGLLHPGVQTPNQPGLVHPGGQIQPGLLHPGVQTPNQPGLVHPGGQTQPGLLHPGVQTPNQPGLVHPGGQTQPGLLHPGGQTPNQPGLVHPGGQNQLGLLHPGVQTPNQPGLVHPGVQPGLTHAGAQTQAGFVLPAAQPQSQPGLARPSFQTNSQTGLLRPGLQSQAGLLHPGPQPQSQPGLVHPAFQSQTGLLHPSHLRPGLTRPGLQSRPGLLRPGLQAQLQPGLVRPGLQPQAQPGLLRPGLQSQPSLLQSTALFYPSAGAGTQLTREQCQVTVGRMPCVAPQGREGCLQAGCCYDDMDRVAPCYYGNTATVQCLLDGHFVMVVPRGSGPQPYNLDSVRLASAQRGCEPLRVTEAFVMFHFAVTQCGTTVQGIEDRLIYENQLISTIDVQGSPRSITRDSVYILQARCIYNASDLLPLRMEVAVPPTAVPLAVLGPLGLQLRVATDESYSSYHTDGDYPLVKVLRDPVYVEVRLLQKTDPNLVLVLHQCWAAPSPDAAAEPQWAHPGGWCPFEGDNYRTQLVRGPASPQLPFPSHYQRFVISTFTFVEPPSMAVLEGEVYISCSASVCHLAQPEPCRPSCQLGVPSRARRSLGDTRATVTSRGRVVFPQVPKRRRG
ncbi:LOW QUALITY PROTEIN: zona pellucida sperm-binding protein 1 [Leptosomus discolor]